MTAAPPTPIHDLVAMAHVADPARSIAFYQRLGFRAQHTLERDGRIQWAWLESDAARLMVVLASAPVDPEQQAVLFYLYVTDLPALRRHLMAENIAVGDITYPDYMPEGELRIVDPDGYCLLIGQSQRGPGAEE